MPRLDVFTVGAATRRRRAAAHRRLLLALAAGAVAAAPASAQRLRWQLAPADVGVLHIVRADSDLPVGDTLDSLLGRLTRPAVDTVPLGTPVDILIISTGSSSCTRPGPVRVSATRHALTLRVFDYVVVTPGIACTADAAPFPHGVRRRFREPGVKTIRAIGRPDRSLTRTLTVIPATP